MDQIIYKKKKKLVNSIKPDPIKDQGPHQLHTWNKTALHV